MMSADLTLRLAAAALAGAVLGVNRKLRGKAAGLRTHSLVALGSALAVIAGELVAGADRGAVTRVIQGTIAGIGFLGAGAILKQGTVGVRGLTTAATIWLAASVGVACGAGLYGPALVAIGLALLVLIIGGPIERLVRRAFGAGDDEHEPARPPPGRKRHPRGPESPQE
jgi:putative Mg2+ transporter-C (MgtC) family protein